MTATIRPSEIPVTLYFIPKGSERSRCEFLQSKKNGSVRINVVVESYRTVDQARAIFLHELGHLVDTIFKIPEVRNFPKGGRSEWSMNAKELRAVYAAEKHAWKTAREMERLALRVYRPENIIAARRDEFRKLWQRKYRGTRGKLTNAQVDRWALRVMGGGDHGRGDDCG